MDKLISLCIICSFGQVSKTFFGEVAYDQGRACVYANYPAAYYFNF